MNQKKDEGAAFKEAYTSLNAAQKQAVDTIEGPVMVIAGPGTGKTQILTLRIANILLKTDVKAENILALTFTDSGARAMRERLESLIGDRAFDVAIYTFHSFADSLIGRYPEAYPEVIGGRAASDIERVQIIESILSDKTFKALRPSGDPAFYVQPILRAIQTLKQEYITPDHFATSIHAQENQLAEIEQFHIKGAHKGKERGEYKDATKHFTRNQELLQAYRLYESALRADKLYDFDDMIVKTVEALQSNEDMLRDLQEQFQYVLADEHQDVNGSQNRILELLVHFHDNPNLFVVGDEKQAIYRFQGASLDNFLYFEDVFKGATTISLTENYRSGQVVLDVAQDLIKTDDLALQHLRVPLHAAAVKKSAVELFEFPHGAIENSWLVSTVKEEIESGVSPEEIVVIVRTNKEVENIAIALRKEKIAAAPSADSDILEHPITAAVINIIKAVSEPTNEAVLFTLLHETFWQLEVSDLATLLKGRSRDIDLAQLIRDEVKLRELEVIDIEAVLKISILIDSVRQKMLTEPPHRLLETLLSDSGMIAQLLKNNPHEGVRIVRRLYDEVEGMVRRGDAKDLVAIVQRLELHRQYGLTIKAPFVPFGQKAVQVMTAHKSKGLEFNTVFIPHLSDRAWGNKKGRSLFSLPITKHDVGEFDTAEDDERRLLYVAMTRAKTRLFLSTAELTEEGKGQILSRFISGLDSSLLEQKETETYVSTFSPVGDIKSVAALPITTEMILLTLDKRGFSPTALNNYLKSPWEYFYRNVLQVPQIKVPSLQLGTAVHSVLDTLVKHHASDSLDENLARIPELLKIGLSKEAITDEEFARLHEKGTEMLMAYVPHVFASNVQESKTEFRVEVVLETGLAEYPQLKLNGNLDRVDYKDGVIVGVVDYKTGKPKTRGYIEGSTADSTGDYKRQLTFYALLLSLQSDTAKHCRTGVLSFVEPDSNGRIKEETFVITDEEIAELRTELVRVAKEIIEGKALISPCDPKQCHYCDLVEVWQQAKI